VAHPSDEGWADFGCSILAIKHRLTTDLIDRMAFSPFKFLQEVCPEATKVTWPTCREVTTTIMVFRCRHWSIFFVADQAIRHLVTFRWHPLTSTGTQPMDKRWYRSRLFELREVVAERSEQAKQRGLEELPEQVPVPTEKVTVARRPQDRRRAQILPYYAGREATDEAFHLIKNTPRDWLLGAEQAGCRSRKPC
jgi:preprotein translocase subunit SecE